MSLQPPLYPETSRERDRWILSRRGPRRELAEDRPYAFLREEEPDAAGKIIPTGAIFLTNKECPFRCVMCDLWQNTLQRAVEPGSIPAQIEYALSHWSDVQQLKLYNSGSFFDPQAIPPEDYPAIGAMVGEYGRVIVESHPAFIGTRVDAFRSSLQAPLEVAVGLESSNEFVLQKLNKRMSLDNYRESAEFLLTRGIDLRVFLLLAPPFLPMDEALASTIESVEYAFASGAQTVSLIPTRYGNGAMEELATLGAFSSPNLPLIEHCFQQAMNSKRGRLFLDLWALQKFSSCPACFEARKQRLHQINLQQRVLPAITCHECRADV